MATLLLVRLQAKCLVASDVYREGGILHCVLHRAFEMLELSAGKLARSVLRGGGGGNIASLPDQEKKF